MDERKLQQFVVSANLRSKTYYALLFFPVIFIRPDTVTITQDNRDLKEINASFETPIPSGIYGFNNKIIRDKFIRRCNGTSEMQQALAVQIKMLQQL